MSALFGAGNTPLDYLLVVLVYGALFLVMRFLQRRIPADFVRTFLVLFVGWGVGTFVANYVLYRAGVMSFMPWLNNALHTFVWIGLCLGFLYAWAHRRPMWQQFALFAAFSLVVKVAERMILGTWELDHFFGIRGNTAYIIGWSLMDGLYPVVSLYGLKLVRHFVPQLLAPATVRVGAWPGPP
jgi:hypothetical protein